VAEYKSRNLMHAEVTSPDVTVRARTVTSIRSILKTGFDRAFLEGSEEAPPPTRQHS